MDHNPHKLKEGDTVTLDAQFTNHSEVVIDKFTPLKLHATVYSADTPNDKWQVMTGRLTPIK